MHFVLPVHLAKWLSASLSFLLLCLSRKYSCALIILVDFFLHNICPPPTSLFANFYILSSIFPFSFLCISSLLNISSWIISSPCLQISLLFKLVPVHVSPKFTMCKCIMFVHYPFSSSKICLFIYEFFCERAVKCACVSHPTPPVLCSFRIHLRFALFCNWFFKNPQGFVLFRVPDLLYRNLCCLI